MKIIWFILLLIITFFFNIIFERLDLFFFIIIGTAVFYYYENTKSLVFFVLASLLYDLSVESNMGIGLLSFSISALITLVLFKFVSANNSLVKIIKFSIGFFLNYLLYSLIVIYKGTGDFNLNYLFEANSFVAYLFSLTIFLSLLFIGRSKQKREFYVR